MPYDRAQEELGFHISGALFLWDALVAMLSCTVALSASVFISAAALVDPDLRDCKILASCTHGIEDMY